MTEPAVRFEGISKRFPGVQALSDVSLEIAAGSCHALCGENGAGKSTLGKILAGLQSPDEGRLFVHGKEVRLDSPRTAGCGSEGVLYAATSTDVTDVVVDGAQNAPGMGGY